MMNFRWIVLFLFLGIFFSCEDDMNDLDHIDYNPTSYVLDLPPVLKNIPIPEDNPLTLDGITLGQHLFYDPILSQDSTMSCASCHAPEKSFTDGLAFSEGVTGEFGTRSSMSVINAAFYTGGLFWDGRALSLEEQAIGPVENPIELHENWDNVEKKLKNHVDYTIMFRKAFGILDSDEITRELAVKAISQFERIIISGFSKFDKSREGLAVLTDEEVQGRDIFFDSNFLLPDGECAHCHNTPLFTTNEYFNNGLDAVESLWDFNDLGLGEVTGIPFDNGKFRAPTLRNIVLTAPYMHDGRFNTLEEVMDHYNEGTHASDNTPEIIRDLELTELQKENVIKFLLTLTDTSYLENELVLNPFE